MPLAPAAAAWLRNAGARYHRIEDFYREEELSRLAADRFAEVARWAESVDRYLQVRVPEFREAGFGPTRLYFFFVAWLANAVFIRGYALARLAEALAPARISWFQPPAMKFEVGPDLGYFTSSISLWKLSLPHWAGTLATSTWPRPPVDGDAVMPARLAVDGLHAAPRWALGRHRAIIRREGLSGYALRVADNLWSALTKPFPRRRRLEGGALFLQGNYDLRSLERVLVRRLPCLHWSDVVGAAAMPSEVADMRHHLAALWSSGARSPEIRLPFSVEGVDFWPVVEPRFRLFWNDIIPAMWGHYVLARRFLSRRRPAVVVAPYAEAVWQAPTLAAARKLGIPTVVYQHGGMVGVCELPVFRETDRYVADHMLVYGDGVKAYFDEDDLRRGADRATTTAVGSARLDAVRAGRRRWTSLRRRARPVVLYIAEQLRGNAHYLNCNGYPDVSFYELQANLVDLFGEFPHIHFIYKAFADHLPNPIPEATRRVANIETVGFLERRATTLMWDADLIVLDMPSTALLECLLTPKPLVVFADSRSLRMREEAKRLLRRRCLLTDTPEEFLAELRRVLSMGTFAQFARSDDSFLSAYGTHLNDGRSADRAADAICRIAGC